MWGRNKGYLTSAVDLVLVELHCKVQKEQQNDKPHHEVFNIVDMVALVGPSRDTPDPGRSRHLFCSEVRFRCGCKYWRGLMRRQSWKRIVGIVLMVREGCIPHENDIFKMPSGQVITSMGNL